MTRAFPIWGIGGNEFNKYLHGAVTGIYPRSLLALDACVNDNGGFGGVTLAQNVETSKDVDAVLSSAVKAGGRILKPASNKEWGGYSGYFADPDGHPGEIAYNPVFTLDRGVLVLPG